MNVSVGRSVSVGRTPACIGAEVAHMLRGTGRSIFVGAGVGALSRLGEFCIERVTAPAERVAPAGRMLTGVTVGEGVGVGDAVGVAVGVAIGEAVGVAIVGATVEGISIF